MFPTGITFFDRLKFSGQLPPSVATTQLPIACIKALLSCFTFKDGVCHIFAGRLKISGQFLVAFESDILAGWPTRIVMVQYVLRKYGVEA